METEEYTEQIEKAERERFHITDEGGANWYLRLRGNIENERQRIEAQTKAMLARLDADGARLDHLFAEELEQWACQQISGRKDKRKSLVLHYGTVGFRKSGGGLKVTDTDAALPHAHAMGCTKVEVATGAYLEKAQEHLTETGELLPGLERIPEADKFFARYPKIVAETEPE